MPGSKLFPADLGFQLGMAVSRFRRIAAEVAEADGIAEREQSKEALRRVADDCRYLKIASANLSQHCLSKHPTTSPLALDARRPGMAKFYTELDTALREFIGRATDLLPRHGAETGAHQSLAQGARHISHPQRHAPWRIST